MTEKGSQSPCLSASRKTEWLYAINKALPYAITLKLIYVSITFLSLAQLGIILSTRGLQIFQCHTKTNLFSIAAGFCKTTAKANKIKKENFFKFLKNLKQSDWQKQQQQKQECVHVEYLCRPQLVRSDRLK